jgi:hypothetical protein
METVVVIEKTKIHKVSIKNKDVPLREDIPVTETHTVKLFIERE